MRATRGEEGVGAGGVSRGRPADELRARGGGRSEAKADLEDGPEEVGHWERESVRVSGTAGRGTRQRRAKLTWYFVVHARAGQGRGEDGSVREGEGQPAKSVGRRQRRWFPDGGLAVWGGLGVADAPVRHASLSPPHSCPGLSSLSLSLPSPPAQYWMPPLVRRLVSHRLSPPARPRRSAGPLAPAQLVATCSAPAASRATSPRPKLEGRAASVAAAGLISLRFLSLVLTLPLSHALAAARRRRRPPARPPPVRHRRPRPPRPAADPPVPLSPAVQHPSEPVRAALRLPHGLATPSRPKRHRRRPTAVQARRPFPLPSQVAVDNLLPSSVRRAVVPRAVLALRAQHADVPPLVGLHANVVRRRLAGQRPLYVRARRVDRGRRVAHAGRRGPRPARVGHGAPDRRPPGQARPVARARVRLAAARRRRPEVYLH